MSIWSFHRSRVDVDAETLLAAVTAASRRPEFFGQGRVPDTIEGRFEMMSVNGTLALIRVEGEPDVRPLAQAFTDKFFRFFDAGLREAGVSDTAVPRRMSKMAGSFYGRLAAYGSALSEPAALESALARNVWRLDAHPFASVLARYVATTAQVQASAPISAMFTVEGWPQLEAGGLAFP